MDSLPVSIENAPSVDSIRLIDIQWIDRDRTRVMAAFEVGHITSIYSGIVCMLDLALSSDLHAADGLFLVAPDAREGEVRAQLRRPASVASPICRCATYHMTILEKHRDAIARFGTGIKGIQAISRVLSH
ncbi:MAG: hypothetical protein Q8M88_14645 [Phenylobacterium sp.]|uniref:hypothetical protein n=1 Tax=Phenylobacterium sp. TaxID=1871053 RepID=UPI0027359AF7|nr:hypothetical protein [Phenylobacterium sp.]MDP3175668.1 hypothetical protein [Phenylobacterium sp.]